ncbi:hypothetical protein MMC07_004151 [Pseudocyphellaria aurata]|nr:hypothetical protein [Pseudocyphellaria aurata]
MPRQPVGGGGTNGPSPEDDDPFKSTPPTQHPHPHPHRFSSFDTQLFALNHPSSSPSQAKRALEAHMVETERRLQETSRLGTALLEQKQRLSERIQEVETQQADGEIGPELRQKLIDVEKEYNEVGRASARAFLGPKPDAQGAGSFNSPFALDGKRPVSPSKFSSEAVDSPSKLHVPRKQRNQPSNRVGDIEFAVDINNSLIAQVRQLQAIISERDEALKTATLEKSRLELEAEGFSQRLRSLDESEQRYKDENWSLETQTHELMAEVKDAASREQKLHQALALTTSEKSEGQRDLDDLKQHHGRLVEDLTAIRKNYDSELAGLRRNVNLGESEKGVLQRRVEELTAQNQELAKAVAAHFRNEERELAKEPTSDLEEYSLERSELEQSPPPSPTKGIPRHAMLESETLKSSLHHAHRMIQTLKGNVHREKTEKLDLKRLLQEARDELEIRRTELGGANQENKRLKARAQQDLTKKGVRPNMLGQGRNSRTDVLLDEDDWEDHNGQGDNYQKNGPGLHSAAAGAVSSRAFDISDAYQTANETEDAFETANERDSTTENEAFQTGAESIAGESSDTETEGAIVRGGTVRALRPSPLTLAKAGDRRPSYGSTASTDDDERNVKTPVQAQPQRYRLKVNRGSRRSRVGSELLPGSNPASAKNSPASLVGSSRQGGQSLFAELGDLDSGDSGKEGDRTPSRSVSSHRSIRSTSRSISRHRSTPSLRRSVSARRSTHGGGAPSGVQSAEEPPLPRLPLVDSGMMTDPWVPVQQTIVSSGPHIATATTEREAGSITPKTPLTKNVGTMQPKYSTSESTTVAASTPPRTIWDQPLGVFASIIPSFGSTSRSSPSSAALTSSSRETHAPESPEANIPYVQRTQGLPAPSSEHISVSPQAAKEVRSQPQAVTPAPVFTFSPIRSLETFPTNGTQPTFVSERFASDKKRSTDFSGTHAISAKSSEAQLEGFDTARIIDTIFGSSKSRDAPPPRIAEDDTSQDFVPLPMSTITEGKRPFREIPVNAVQKQIDQADEPHPVPIDMADQGSQTVLSSEQIDNMLHQYERAPITNNQKVVTPTMMKPLSEIGAVSPPLHSHRFPESVDTTKAKTTEQNVREANTFAKVPRRPLSATSIRSRTGQYPPLPPDHQRAIAAAAQKAPSVEPSATVMGPPLAPASAYRSNVARPRTPSRPRTPNDQRPQVAAAKGATTPRARHSTRSQVSRRSSVSSFASELDERFNIRVDGVALPHGLESSTDPRMIQAITQTMIGEFLWKYTRKAGRGEMSNNRHRRFFWVHPYTRTLYWSDKDPATAGRAELKAKSVAIEAVQVVTDDNPMPPGLHRKSLVIITPGRSVKFTATTGQRHETWFNSLSYLLLRADGEPGHITTEDVNEFNPSFNRRSTRTVASRISLASFRSNASQRSLNARATSGASTRGKSYIGTQPAHSVSVNGHHSRQLHHRRSSRNQGSLSSRLSGYWRPGNASARASFSSRHSKSGQQFQPYEEHEVDGATHDSAEDLRQVIEQRERGADQLENDATTWAHCPRLGGIHHTNHMQVLIPIRTAI